jgi:hypothetical protein
MWVDRLVFATRTFLADLGPRLGSWRLSVVLMVLAALYYSFLAIWAGSSPPRVVQNIAGLVPFWLLYALLLVNTAVCLWRRLPQLRRDLRQGQWTALGTFLFHGAFLLVALGFLLTLAGRQEARVWVAVGEEFTGAPEQYLSQSAPRPLAAGRAVSGFTVDEIRPEFWRNQLLFTTLEADLTLASGRRATTRINRPLWVGWSTFLRLSGFGYTPRYELRDRYGHVLDSSFVKLNVFPPGQRDYFVAPDYPHRIYVEVFPDYEEVDGRHTSKSLNLINPATSVQVYRGRLALAEGLLRYGEAMDFEGLTLVFPDIRYWGEFTAVSDPGAPLLFFGYLVGVLGLLVKLPRSLGSQSRTAAAATADRQEEFA